MSQPEPSTLPPWPKPRWRTLGGVDDIPGWIANASKDSVLGVAIAEPPPLARADDRPRLALSRPDPTSEVAIVDLAATAPDAIRPLFDPGGPYLVFHDAHESLRTLASFGLNPPRVGSIRPAAVLLSEGTRREHQLGLERCVEQILAHRFIARAPLAGTDDDLASAASTLIPLMRALTPMLRNRGLARVYDLECRLLPAVVDMERAGVMLDGAKYQRIVDSWIRERQSCDDSTTLARLDKLISTYGYWARDFVDLDGRIHCLLHPLAADSGRFSCTRPNLQQVPGEHVAPGLRSCFHAAPGHRFVIADYAQIEMRVAAHLAPCAALRAVFQDGRDPHRATAASITGKPENQIDAMERKLAKAVNFGFLFGMGVARFRDYARTGYGVELSVEAAGHAREAFFSTFPGLLAWHRRTGTLERRRSNRPVVVRTALGRRKRFPPGSFSFTAALNIPVQGTAAEGFKLAMIELHRRLPAVQARGVLCVHDEYVAEVPEARAEEAREMVASIMTEAMATVVDSVPIEVHTDISATWS